jgi:hypothetical protein
MAQTTTSRKPNSMDAELERPDNNDTSLRRFAGIHALAADDFANANRKCSGGLSCAGRHSVPEEWTLTDFWDKRLAKPWFEEPTKGSPGEENPDWQPILEDVVRQQIARITCYRGREFLLLPAADIRWLSHPRYRTGRHPGWGSRRVHELDPDWGYVHHLLAGDRSLEVIVRAYTAIRKETPWVEPEYAAQRRDGTLCLGGWSPLRAMYNWARPKTLALDGSAR